RSARSLAHSAACAPPSRPSRNGNTRCGSRRGARRFGPISYSIRKAYSRPEAILGSVDQVLGQARLLVALEFHSQVGQSVHNRWKRVSQVFQLADGRAQYHGMIGAIEANYRVVLLVVGREQVVAQPQVQGQPRRHTPVVLEVAGVLPRPGIKQSTVQLVVIV